MSQWSNGPQQTLTINGTINVDFINVIVPGNNPLVQGGNHTVSYAISLVKPSGEWGPTPVTAALTVNGVVQQESRTFTDLDTSTKETLSYAGELRQLDIGDVVGVRIKADPDSGFTQPIGIHTSPNRCTLTLRRVTGQGT